jgi:hypothetical protein
LREQRMYLFVGGVCRCTCKEHARLRFRLGSLSPVSVLSRSSSSSSSAAGGQPRQHNQCFTKGAARGYWCSVGPGGCRSTELQLWHPTALQCDHDAH